MRGILIAAATATFFALFAIRASSVYFFMITLALGQCEWEHNNGRQDDGKYDDKYVVTTT